MEMALYSNNIIACYYPENVCMSYKPFYDLKTQLLPYMYILIIVYRSGFTTSAFDILKIMNGKLHFG